MTDQEQTERGASTVVIRKTMQQCIDELRRSEHSAGMVADWLEPLRADLERVTAERDAMREVLDDLWIAADNYLENDSTHNWEELSSVTETAGELLGKPDLDATRKATADAAEQPARAEALQAVAQHQPEVEAKAEP